MEEEEESKKAVSFNVEVEGGAGYKLELASRAQVSSISVRHHTTRHLMFSIFPQCSSPPSIPPLSRSLWRSFSLSEVGHRVVPLDLGSSACWVEGGCILM